jgi:hypothetical protein
MIGPAAVRTTSTLARVCLLAFAFSVLAGVVGVACAAAIEPAFGIERFFTAFSEPPFSEPFLDEGGTPFTQAGGHPFAVTATILFNHLVKKEEVVDPGGTPEEKVPTEVLTGGDAENLAVDFPAGVIADPEAVPKCEQVSLEEGSCPASSAIGLMAVYLTGFPYRVFAPLYNMVPPVGVPAQFGTNPGGLGYVIHVDGRLDPGAGYALSAEISSIPRSSPIYAMTLTLWSHPTDPGHDAERGPCAQSPPSAKAEGVGASCPLEPSETSDTAFLTMPTSCPGEPLSSTVTVESWQQPGVPFESIANSPALTGCGALQFALQFSPSIEVQPETSVTDTPTGLHVDVHVPQEDSVGGLATASLRGAVVSLPEGLTIDPSVADGLAGCTETPEAASGSEPERPGGEIELHSSRAVECPNASRIGTVEIDTPLFDHPLPGAVYLAEPYENPFSSPQDPGGSLLAIYLVVDDPVSGVVVKLAAHFEPNPQTGRLTMTLNDSPLLPIEDLKLDLWGGPRAPLVTPAACGTATTTTDLTPWSSEEAVTPSSGFTIDQGCSDDFDPAFIAGSLSSLAGAYSPFTVTFSRQDSEEDLSAVTFTTPPGLLASPSNVPVCPEPQAQQGECGQASEVGTATVAVGAGSDPIYLSGRIYLTGPYSGGPFGLSIVVPANVGPFDLGVVVLRASIAVNSRTAALTITTTPLPQIIDGIPLQIKRVKVTISRPGFMSNPTNCDPLSVTATISSAARASSDVSSPFEVSNCASLKFSPALTALTRANGEFAGHGASLHVVIVSPAGQANMRSLKVDLPQSLPARGETVQHACPERSFDVSPAACPKASIVGSASIQTPILSTPMTGQAILVSHGAALPNLVLVLQAQGVTIDLSGAVYVNERNATSVTFRSIPDVPIRRLDLILPEGPRSILAATAGLCRTPLHMSTAITAQDNAQVKHTVTVAVEGCRKPKKKRHPARRKG